MVDLISEPLRRGVVSPGRGRARGGGGSLGAEGEGDVREEMLKRKEDGCEVPQGFEEGARPPRFFTQRECCRLMGFPEWYVLCVCSYDE